MTKNYIPLKLLPGLVLAFLASATFGAARSDVALASAHYQIEGVERGALLYIPPSASSNETPVVFVFHGHGGTSRGAARSFAIHRHWPEAIAVYMQGLNTPGRLTDPEGKKPGWQKELGDQGDRDLKFFDAVLAKLKQDYRVDTKRIYATGHSNGGAFTYLLWSTRDDIFAAVAPSAAVAPAKDLLRLQPKPAMHLAGENDTLVKYEWQQLAMRAIRKVNGCTDEGTQWAPFCTLYPSPTGTPVVTFIHSGGHQFRPEAQPLIVKFFKQHSR